MSKFKSIDVGALLGFTPLTKLTDAQIWAKFVTKQACALLGDVVKVDGPFVLETIKPLFPGDANYNLNNHRMYGGLSTDTVRFPYIAVVYHTTFGALVIKRDAAKVKVQGYFGKLESGKAQLIYEAALRDRRFDGTCRGNDSALLKFPYDDKDFNRPLPGGLSVELSTYGFLPGSRITDLLGKREEEFQKFVEQPFAFLNDPEKFLKHFQRAWNGNLAPGQIAPTIPDISKVIIPQMAAVARSVGYDFIEGCASHYHVAWAQISKGFRYTYKADHDTLYSFVDGMNKIKASGLKLTRPQESWVCVVQSLRPIELIPEGLYLNGPVWPQNNLDQKNLWTNLPLTEKAKQLVPAPIVTQP